MICRPGQVSRKKFHVYWWRRKVSARLANGRNSTAAVKLLKQSGSEGDRFGSNAVMTRRPLCAKRERLPLIKDSTAIEVMRTLKAALDPDGILNPGKVL